MYLSKIRRKRLLRCPVCHGDGYLVNEYTESEHHPDCMGDCINCPIPVPAVEQVTCEFCSGTGKVTKIHYREFVVKMEYPLKACEIIEKLKLND